jgi:hypothetical protein
MDHYMGFIKYELEAAWHTRQKTLMCWLKLAVRVLSDGVKRVVSESVIRSYIRCRASHVSISWS